MKKLIAVILGALAFASCQNYQYDNELRHEIETKGREKTEKWFAENLPEAKDVVIETRFRVVWNYITNETEGSFLLADSTMHWYVYNWESDSCLTTIGVADTDSTTLWGYTISNQDMFPFTHKTELRRDAFSETLNMLYMPSKE